MEHIYHKVHGYFNYPELYSKLAKTLPDKFKFAEIGVWKGRSLIYFVVEAINAGKNFTAYAIDTFEGSEEHQKGKWCYDPIINTKDGLYNHFLSNIEPIKNKIKVVRGKSTDASLVFPDEYFDTVFIDGAHDYDSVLADLKAYYPKVKRGNPIYGHDLDWPGVKKAVTEFCENNKLNFTAVEPVRKAGICYEIK